MHCLIADDKTMKDRLQLGFILDRLLKDDREEVTLDDQY